MEKCFKRDSCKTDNLGTRLLTAPQHTPWKQPLWGVKGRRMGKLRSSPGRQSQQSPQAITQGAQELGWLFKVAQN